MIPFEPMYRSSLVYYMVGRAQLRDDEATTDARAASLLTKFTQQMLIINSLGRHGQGNTGTMAAAYR